MCFKFIFTLTMLLLVYVNLDAGYSPRLKTDQELSASEWTDHVNHFSKLLEVMDIEEFLEFGVGEGTKFFLDHCQSVTSVELLAKNNLNANLAYYNLCLNLFKNYSNWRPSCYFCSDEISQAVDIAEKGINPRSIDSRYFDEINALCDSLFKDKKYDVAFVDPGVIIRGDFVKALFGRVKVIVAHDVAHHANIYGWAYIDEHPDYVRIRYLEGSGTAFWVHRDLQEIIAHLEGFPHH